MDSESEIMLIRAFTIAYVLVAVVSAYFNANYEFLYYAIFISALIFIIQINYKKFHLAVHILLLLSILGFLHFLGGEFRISGTRLYDLKFLNGIFEFDNVVHFFGGLATALLGYNMLLPHIDTKFKKHHIVLPFLIICIALGIGALIELLEFGAVVFLNAAATVGSYLNNALDLFFDTLGAFVAALFIHVYYHGKLEKLKEI